MVKLIVPLSPSLSGTEAGRLWMINKLIKRITKPRGSGNIRLKSLAASIQITPIKAKGAKYTVEKNSINGCKAR
jgi:hypothetical protein